MKKLKLKHLAGYLPYKLRVTTTFGERNFKNTFELVIDFQPNNLDVISIESIMTHYGEGHKPILRPLSDLNSDNCMFLSGDACMLIHEEEHLYSRIEHWKYSDVIKLMEKHFDIHGLIPAGLAVDINTLQ